MREVLNLMQDESYAFIRLNKLDSYAFCIGHYALIMKRRGRADVNIGRRVRLIGHVCPAR